MARKNTPNPGILFLGVAAALLGAAPAAAQNDGGFAGWYARGGVFMHPLLACLVVGAIFIAERVYTLARARVDTKVLMGKALQALRSEGVDGALAVCERTRGPVSAVLHAGLLRAQFGPDAARQASETAGAIEVSFLERGIVVISTVSTVAPMLGLLGTVMAMMKVFGAMAALSAVSANVVLAAVAGALIPTIAGLSVAILCVVGRAYCAGTVDRFVLEMEEATANLVNELVEIGKRRGH
jgi:biopolymer transport protein ExbB